MRDTVKTTSTACLLVFLLAGLSLGQNRLQSGPSPAVVGPAYDVSIGYANLTMAIPSAGHVNLSGVDASGTVALSPRWGATIDSSYLRSSDVLSTTHQGYMLSLHTGPVFYPVEHGNTRLFVRALAGAALVDGAVPLKSPEYYCGWLVRPTYAFGGGIEHSVSGQFVVRINADYVRTSFYGATGAVQPQNNLRVAASVVFHLRQHRHQSRARLR